MVDQPQIDGLRLTEFLAQGGWGEVFAGERVSDGRAVAVKVSHRRLTREPTAVLRMLQEGELCWSLDHPNVIRVLDWGRLSDGRVFLVMERLHGATLEEVLRRDGPLTAMAALELARGVAAGLRAIHRRAVHRDIKPSNIFLQSGACERRSVKILDLGIAALAPDDPNRLVQTLTGEVACSPAYTAPERLRTGASDARVDVYALGATLFESLTGRPPYEGPALSIAVQVCRAQTPPPVPTLGLPSAFQALIARMLDPNPLGRPATCDDVLEALDAIDATLELDRFTTNTGSVGPINATSASAGTGFMAVARGAVFHHYHPDHVPEAIAARLRNIESLSEAYTAARIRGNTAQSAAAELACRLDARARELALERDRRAALAADVEAQLDTLLRERQSVSHEIREVDREYAACSEVFAGAFVRASAAASALGEPIDTESGVGRDANDWLVTLDALSERRARLHGAERALSARLESLRAETAARTRATYEVRRAHAEVEFERLGTLAPLEREARETEEEVERLTHDQNVAHLELSVELQRIAFR